MLISPLLFEEIVRLLTPLPCFESERARRALLLSAGLRDILTTFDCAGKSQEFAPLLLHHLAEYGDIAGEPALFLLLRSVAETVGTDKQRLLHEFETRIVAEQSAESPKPAEKKTALPAPKTSRAGVSKFAVFGMVLLLAIGIGASLVWRDHLPFFEHSRLPLMPKAGETWREPMTGMEFVYVPGGSFLMGQSDTEREQLLHDPGQELYDEYYTNELPRHQVTLDGFWIGKYEVTNAQYRVWRPVHDSRDYQGNTLNDERQPVVWISGQDARNFAEWLTATYRIRHGGDVGFRLPTESQWEYACRAGTTTIRFWGDDAQHACAYASVADMTAKKELSDWDRGIHWCSDNFAVTAPVGSFQPNPFGLYDMLGNVWEWTADEWHDTYRNAPLNGDAWIGGDASSQVMRGGAWYDHPYHARCATRYREPPESLSMYAGLRVVAFRK